MESFYTSIYNRPTGNQATIKSVKPAVLELREKDMDLENDFFSFQKKDV